MVWLFRDSTFGVPKVEKFEIRISKLVSLFITVPQFFSNKMGITRTVKKPKNNYIIISYMKINRVWKPFKKTTPHSMINIWITQWIQANFTQLSEFRKLRNPKSEYRNSKQIRIF